VILTDTAGLREAAGKVEAEGVRRALARAEEADVVLWLIDATAPIWEPPAALKAKSCVAALNKIDLAPEAAEGRSAIPISAKTGQGVDRLVEALEEQAALATEAGAGSPLMTRARHRVELEGTRNALQRFGDASLSPELKAEELRIAARHLGRLTGRIDVEEVLGAIFSEFCIGK
jgi:tRNA modification GTPase